MARRWKKIQGVCPVCERKGTYCRITKDETIVLCRYRPDGCYQEKTDKNGAPFYLHRVKGSPYSNGHAEPRRRERKPAQPEPPIADETTRHAVYSELLRHAAPTCHLERLRQRGLSDDEIARRDYGEWRLADHRNTLGLMRAVFADDTLLAVPGFFRTERGEISVSCVPSLLVPVRNAAGLIIGLKFRPNQRKDDGPKYLWLSSRERNGPGPDSWPHVPLDAPQSTVWRLSEGELKADVATALSGVPTISISGVSNWRPALPILKELGAETVRLAFDSDAWTKREVAAALHACATGLVAEGFTLELERWDPAAGKGIDDVLAAGGTVVVLTGPDAMTAVLDAAKATGVPLPVNVAAVCARIKEIIASGGSAGIYRDQELLRNLSRLKHENVPEFKALKTELKAVRGFSPKDLEDALKAMGSWSGPPPSEGTNDDDDDCLPGTEENPHRLARLFLATLRTHPDGLTLRYWQNEFLEWNGAAYRPVPDHEMRARIARTVDEEFHRIYNKALMRFGMNVGSGKAAERPKLLSVTTNLVTNIMQALSGIVLLPLLDCPEQPVWLIDSAPWPAEDTLPARNALVNLDGLVKGTVSPLPPTPRFFSTFALDYDFQPNAPDPIKWRTFLGEPEITPDSTIKYQLWPNDPDSIATLQEWMGLLLTRDTTHQKMLMMIGPKRSGKGTIIRIIKRLVGPANTASPRLASLATNFGLEPLIGKQLAIVPDARLSGRTDQAGIVESLLSIRGEDDMTIDRKNRTSWTGKLGTRIAIVSNELPRLKDSSAALADSFIVLRLTQSFFGNEDKTLTRTLLTELPGILLWAIKGWSRLRERGHFIQPESGKQLVDRLRASSSPITAFIEDCCELGTGEDFKIQTSHLFDRWKQWCQSVGLDKHAGSEDSFGIALHSAIPCLDTIRPRQEGKRPRFYTGIRLQQSPTDAIF